MPVRITLDAQQLAAHPLRVGLSMVAEVDVSQKNGKTLADAPRPSAQAEVHAYSVTSDAADQNVDRVIAANMGRAAKPTLPVASPLPAVKSGAGTAAANTSVAAAAAS